MPYIAKREEQRLVQFLMALRLDFKGLHETILHCNPLPMVESVVHDLIVEETHIKSQVEKGLRHSLLMLFLLFHNDLILQISLDQKLHLMNVLFIKRKIIGSLSAHYWWAREIHNKEINNIKPGHLDNFSNSKPDHLDNFQLRPSLPPFCPPQFTVAIARSVDDYTTVTPPSTFDT